MTLIGTEWLLLITNLPGENKTRRMRIWRALKAAGAASLRDGVYLLPDSGPSQTFAEQALEIRAGGGSAYIFAFEADSTEQQNTLLALFDRTTAYQHMNSLLDAFKFNSAKRTDSGRRRCLAALSRDLTALLAIDFFPGKSRAQMESAFADAYAALDVRSSSDEPQSVRRAIPRCDRQHYQGRTWATRKHLWIDRVCSAWLIRRFVDPKAKFLWLDRIKDRPQRVVGFDFNGAEFSHVDSKVTFEVLLTSFGLETDIGLTRLGSVVHFLDVGGIPVAEAPGLAAIVSGARSIHTDDDALLLAVTSALDGLYEAYRSGQI